MEKRKEIILSTIIKEHVRTGAPVASGVLVEKYKLDISPATVRNEMAELEEEGFIIQPHTSAGRIPTEAAYEFHIANAKEKKLSSGEEERLGGPIGDEVSLRAVAKELSAISDKAVFWAFHRHNVYYTGVYNLFSQPEFAQLDIMRNLSQVIDRMDDVIDNIFEGLRPGISIHIGSRNPFGNFCGSVIGKYKTGNQTGLFGLLGPMRMDYQHDKALIAYLLGRMTI